MKHLPNRFWERIQSLYNEEEITIIKKWFSSGKKPVSFRVNTLLSDAEEIESTLKKHALVFHKHPFLKDAYQLAHEREKTLWNLDIFQEGKIYLQSLSSQIPVHFLDVHQNSKVLDITAAPGSKTSQIAAKMNNQWEIIANDNNTIRIEKLKFTLNRQGVANTKVVKNDATKIHHIFEKETFDAILADLPCSAEGRINLHNEKSFWFWSEENILKNATLQKNILNSLIPLLKKWGNLVYSTCTLAPEENEEMVEYILNNFPEMKIFPIDFESNFIRKWKTLIGGKKLTDKVSQTIRCLPNEETEWFYIAKFIKQ